MSDEETQPYRLGLGTQIIEQLLVLHGWCFAFSLDEFLQSLSHFLFTLSRCCTHTYTQNT